ncbi:MAG: dicarboxylate/amino acid:cation symporter [Candidatus Amulumruptor caecigallinarius]|nr:dicarboxylate/amino acid:cation symporter [Candidatus Amulumruptor caecigallinarius]
MKKFFSHLLVRILMAMLLGVLFSLFLPLWGVRVFETFNAVFSQLLNFIVPLIILGFVAPAIADVGNKAGKMLLATVVVAYSATLIAGFMSYFVSDLTFPAIICSQHVENPGESPVSLTPYFSLEIPALFPVMTALMTAFMLGLGCVAVNAVSLKRVLDDVRNIVALFISRVIIPLLPVYIFGIFLNMSFTGQILPVLKTFVGIIAVIFAMHVGILIFQFCIAAIFSKGSKNPFKLLATMMPAYFTALGTQSSAATIPVTLGQTIKMGVDRNVAGFTVPLCATIHMSGSTLKIVACAVALMLMQGKPFDFSMFAGFICMLGVTIVAAPGIPGGSIMASLGILTSMLGFTDQDCALMIALYIAMDSFGTACNVTGDGAIAIIINRMFSFGATSGECRDSL